jgi:hypothetical protein
LAGSLQLAGGSGQSLNAILNTGSVGSFAATYTLNFSDENIAGALNKTLTLSLTGTVLLAGDFNRDGIVDGADYVVWHKTQGLTVDAYTWGDGNGDMAVDGSDLALWQEYLGTTAAGGGGLANVPEPASALVVLLTAAALQMRRRIAERVPREWRG